MGRSGKFARAAEKFGSSIASEKWRLVYGAGDVGLMGVAARAAKAAGGQVLGVIPDYLKNLEIVFEGVDSLVITETMHERKKIMFMNSDAIVTLPGGAGTLDELFEIVTWRQLGQHDKPVFLLNVDNYWNRMLEMVEGIVRCGFADADLIEQVRVVDSVDTLIAELREELS